MTSRRFPTSSLVIRSRLSQGGMRFAPTHVLVQVADAHATVARLASQGIQPEEPGSPDGSADFWTAWVTDPDGYRVEFVQWPDGHLDGMTRSDLPAPGQSA
jgi:lactoylglutathione lyase